MAFSKSVIEHISETEQFQITSSFTKVGQEATTFTLLDRDLPIYQNLQAKFPLL
jgi:hypothetical protein